MLAGVERQAAELLENAHKSRVQAKLESFQPYELITRFGAGEPRGYIGCFCGYVEGSSDRAAFFDLSVADPLDLLGASDEDLFAAVDGTPKIIRTVSTNKAPMLLPVAELDPDHLSRAAIIADAPEFRRRVGKAIAARFSEDPDAPPKPVEQQIYGAFNSNADRRLLQEFRSSDWRRRQEIVASLSDPRLRQLGRRLVAFHSPELLTAEEAASFKTYLRAKWHADDPKAEWMTVMKARTAVEELRAQDAADHAALDAIGVFLNDWAA